MINNIKKWIFKFNDLDPDDQLLVAENIANELRDNEMVFDDDEYNNAKSRIVRDFFDSIVHNAKNLKDQKRFADIFKKYKLLSQKNSDSVNNEVLKIVEKYLGIQEQENKEQICQQEGHTFGKWKHNKWTEYVDTYFDHQHVSNYPVERENWERTCSRCGYVEEAEYEPQELIDQRKEKNKKARIQRLERTLKELEGK